jgi:hypothetical protein
VTARLFAIVVLSIGCSSRHSKSDAAIDPIDGDATDAMSCTFGDPSAPTELRLVHIDAASNPVISSTDDPVALFVPAQGGWAVAFGLRVRNYAGCQGTLTAAFRDVCLTDIIKVDRRPVKLEPIGDGWAATTAESYAYLQVCPQPTAPRDLYDNRFVFIIALEDPSGETATTEMTLIPKCPPGEPGCTCECDSDYDLGTCPPVQTDAGVPMC